MNPTKARSLVAKALREGRLKKRPCVRCGIVNSLAHHEDYDKPLDVMWLCRSHHMIRHKEIGWGINGKRHPESESSGMQIRLPDSPVRKLRELAARECITLTEALDARAVAARAAAKPNRAAVPVRRSLK